MDRDAYAELRQPGRIIVTLVPDARRALHRVADANFREPRLEAQRLLTEAVLREGASLELREAPVYSLEDLLREGRAMSALEDELRAMVADEVARQMADARNAPDRLLSVSEAADRLGIGRSATYGLISASCLRSLKVGKRRLVPEAAIREYIETAGGNLMAGNLSIPGPLHGKDTSPRLGHARVPRRANRAVVTLRGAVARCGTCWSEAPDHPQTVCATWTRGDLNQTCVRCSITEAAGSYCTKCGKADALTFTGTHGIDYTADVRSGMRVRFPCRLRRRLCPAPEHSQRAAERQDAAAALAALRDVRQGTEAVRAARARAGPVVVTSAIDDPVNEYVAVVAAVSDRLT